MRVLDLFSGIGGMSIGLERAGLTTVAFCEAGAFQRRVLRKHWPNVPIIDCIETIESAPDVDVIAGGFPCQAYSTAARGRNISAKDLWPEMERVIRLAKPRIVVGENVSERAIKHAAERISGTGYNVTVRRISGADCGAWHQRNRWWFIAHPYDESEFHSALNAEVAVLPEVCSGLWAGEAYARAIRIPDGVRSGVDEHRLTALGNAVMPVIPEAIGRAIMAIEAAA